MGDNNSLAHTKWNCKYHIVACPIQQNTALNKGCQTRYSPSRKGINNGTHLLGFFVTCRKVFMEGSVTFHTNYFTMLYPTHKKLVCKFCPCLFE